MSERIGVEGALRMFGITPEMMDQDKHTNRFYARMILQGADNLTLGLLLTNQQLMIDPAIHELWQGEIRFRKLQVLQDSNLNLRGHGVAGLCTDGGFWTGSYDRVVLDRMPKIEKSDTEE